MAPSAQDCPAAGHEAGHAAALPTDQIVPILAYRGLYVALERSPFRVLNGHDQGHRRKRTRLPEEPRLGPRLRAAGPNQP